MLASICYKANMIKAIFIDMDDTLIVNQVLFDNAKAMLCGYLRSFGILPDEALKVFDKKDAELFKTYGRTPQRLILSFEATLKHFVPQADAEMLSIVQEQAQSVFTTVADVKPGVAEAIEMLAKHYPIYIVTGGVKDVQEFRFKHIPFMDKISGTLIVDDKTEQTYKDALKKWNLKPEETVMIGDSLSTDIFPAVAAGLQAVWIEAHNSAYETKTGFPAKNAFKFSSLLEMARSLVLHKSQLVAPYTPAEPKQPVRKFG